MLSVHSSLCLCNFFRRSLGQKKYLTGIPAVTQWIKGLVLSLHQLRLLLWHKLDPWSQNFCMPGVWPKQNKTKQSKLDV